jgi:two-component system NtrC family sensor kinase
MVKLIAKLIGLYKSVRKRLAVKLILWTGLILVACLEVVFYLDIRSHRNIMVKHMKEEAYRLSDIIKRSIHHDMMRARSHELQEVMETIGAQEDVRKVRVIERGYIKMASNKEEVGKDVDRNAEGCYDCHENEGQKPLTISRYRFFETENGERVLGLVNPLYNDEECHSCHGSEKKVLGVLDIIISLEKVHRFLKANRRFSLIFIVVCFVLIALFTGVFILKSVNRPIKELTYGTRRITNGDLDYHIPIHTKDEIGELADSFNIMTDEIKISRKKIERVKEATIQLEEANTELAIANKKLNQSDKKKSEVVMMVAHDIRAPLASIKSCLRVVLDGYLKTNREKEMEMIRRAENRVESQLAFVKDLLDFTRMEEEHREMKPLSLRPLVLSVVDLMQAWAKDEKISIEIRNLPEAKILGDENLLNRSLTNLISNAIKYSPPNTLVWVNCILKGQQVEIQVGDNGVGIPEDEVPEIFEILFRGVQANRCRDYLFHHPSSL